MPDDNVVEISEEGLRMNVCGKFLKRKTENYPRWLVREKDKENLRHLLEKEFSLKNGRRKYSQKERETLMKWYLIQNGIRRIVYESSRPPSTICMYKVFLVEGNSTWTSSTNKE